MEAVGVYVEAAKKERKKKHYCTHTLFPPNLKKFNFVRFQKRVSYYARILRAQNTDLNLFLQRRPFAKKEMTASNPHILQ